ncbi:M48 family metallopeptidase [Zavarzinella formosa]|uniref:hypothetical protein n=1 Tax=Zavarzinella formosa TaxID=360055 RepID=UPI0002F3D38C|nr:hypothetical protein [Zavarzinella formosa]
MSKLPVVGLCVFAIGTAGCVSPDGKTEMPWDTISRRLEPEREPVQGPIASTKVATRVHAIGAQLTAANPGEFSTKPVFSTIGLSESMVFSTKDGQIVISEGLVNRCTSDDEIAALLSAELGKMTATRFRDSVRSEDVPPDPHLTSDVVGSGNTPDMTRLAEAGLLNRHSPPPRARRPAADCPTPDTAVLSRSYLKKAGFDPECVQRVQPMLKEAEENADKRGNLMQSR